MAVSGQTWDVGRVVCSATRIPSSPGACSTQGNGYGTSLPQWYIIQYRPTALEKRIFLGGGSTRPAQMSGKKGWSPDASASREFRSFIFAALPYGQFAGC